jgi:hypothetical protein
MLKLDTRFDRGSDLLLGSGSIFVVLLALGLVLVTDFVHERVVSQRTHSAADTMIAETKAQFSDIRPLNGTEVRNMRQHLNAVHVRAAQRLGISGLRNRSHAAELAASGRLVRLENNGYYRVRGMSYGVPYVTPDMATLLDLIGARFQAKLAESGLPPYQFLITSATRTRHDQQRLRRRNGNAAATSSHMFGTTVDLHYIQFYLSSDHLEIPDERQLAPGILSDRLNEAYSAMAETHQQQLKAILGRVLTGLQVEGKVLVIYERMQPVFHITVSQRLT